MERAGFYPRVGAFLCELFLFFVITHAAVALDAREYLLSNSSYNDFGVITGGSALLFVFVFGLLEVLGLATPGKRIFRLMVAAADGMPATRSMLWRRVALKYMPAFVMVFPAVLLCLTDPYGPSLPSVIQYGLDVVATIGLAFAIATMLLVTAGCFRALRPDGRAMHDMASGTAVFFRRETRARGFTPIIPSPVTSISATPAKEPTAEAAAATVASASNQKPSASAGD